MEKMDIKYFLHLVPTFPHYIIAEKGLLVKKIHHLFLEIQHR